MPDFTKFIGAVQLMAQAANDPELRKQLAARAAETGVDPDEVATQGTGGNTMAAPTLGGFMLPAAPAAGGAAPAAGGAAPAAASAGVDPATLLSALGMVQPPPQQQFPNLSAPGLRMSPGLDRGALMQLVLQSVIQRSQSQQQTPPGLGQLIGGR